jgi:GDP-4-dehydro-6-deoxy-D-mannose reductase
MHKDKVVVSGINGFVGEHLARELVNSGISVIGIGQDTEPNHNIANILHSYIQTNLIEQWPDIPGVKAVIHLAGLAAVGPSFDKPQLYINTNSAMVTNLCEYYLRQDQKPRIVIVSSGAIYSPQQPMPISEESKIDLASPYAVSKVLNENQAEYYRNRGLDCVIVRPFNHIGPGQTNGFILPDLYNKISSLAEGEDTISTGNVKTRRDYTDVRDIVSAYSKIALAPILKHHTYNICRGASVSGSEIFDKLKEALTSKDIKYKIDKSLVRPTDPKNIVGDSSRLETELGWKPKIDIQQTVIDFVESNR